MAVEICLKQNQAHDTTDDPAIMSLYIVDAGQQRTAETADSMTNTISAQIVEIPLVQATPLATDVPTDQATLVRTTDTSQYKPPDGLFR